LPGEDLIVFGLPIASENDGEFLSHFAALDSNADGILTVDDNGINAVGEGLEIDVFGILETATLDLLGCDQNNGRIIVLGVDQLDGDDFDF